MTPWQKCIFTNTKHLWQTNTLVLKIIVLITCMGAATVLAAYEPDPNASREDVPNEYRWNPTHIFASDEAWASEMASLSQDIPKLATFRGRLGESAATLLDANTATEELLKRYYRVHLYAQIKYDVKRNDSALRGSVDDGPA